MEIGLVTGEVLLTDSTHVRANAANNKRETVTVKFEPTEYIKKLDETALAEGLLKEAHIPVEKTVEQTKNLTDPDCGLLRRPGKPTGFHYLNHQSVDGNSGIITDVYVTPANTVDHMHHTKRVKYQIEKFGFQTQAVGADAGYDEPEIHVEMLKRNIKTYIPRKARGVKEPDGTFTRENFQYDQEQDVYICPNDCVLKFSTFRKGRGIKRYSGRISDCKSCPIRSKYIPVKSTARHIERSYYWTEYEKQHENDTTQRYLEIQKLRKIWCEGTFSHQKARHYMTRAKMRGITQTTGQCLLSACAVNIKRMIKWMKGRPLNPHASTSVEVLSLLRAFFMPFCRDSPSDVYSAASLDFTVSM